MVYLFTPFFQNFKICCKIDVKKKDFGLTKIRQKEMKWRTIVSVKTKILV